MSVGNQGGDLIDSRGSVRTVPRTFGANPETVAYLEGLYEKYLGELKDVTAELSALWNTGRFRGSRGTYDIEGELYYMLCREAGARNILEMASASGWSTLYLAAAAAANGGQAKINSFELNPVNVQRFRENVISRHPFVTMHEGDCRREFERLNLSVAQPFDFVLLDVHVKDFHQFAFRRIFPQTDGVVFIHDLLPDDYPRNHPESVFFLWLLLRGGVPFLPIATLLEQEGIRRIRRALTSRYTDGSVRTAAKAVLLAVEGSAFAGEQWEKLTAVTYDQFPPRGLEQYTDIPGQLDAVPLTKLLREAMSHRVINRLRRRVSAGGRGRMTSGADEA